MPMLLVDSIYVNLGGALVLLRYLVEKLQAQDVCFFLLADARCKNEFKDLSNVEYRVASMSSRRDFYVTHRDEFSSVLCFGNVPPPIALDLKVYTYLHNINLLKIPSRLPFKRRLLSVMKQRVIDFYGKNTDVWIVQTENTKNELKRHLLSGGKQVLIMPFYHISDELKAAKNISSGRTDFALIGELSYPRGHGVILDVWKRLHEMGFDRTLHLTVSNDTERQKEYCQRVKQLQCEGVKIKNHGFVPFSDVVDIYKRTKAIVYPSLNESLGLSIIEAIESGCDVLTADLPYARSICKSSLCFDPTSIDSICNAIIEFETNGAPHSELIIRDMVTELIDLVK